MVATHKKRSKKHNIHKRFQRTAEASFKDTALCYATNQGFNETSLIRIKEAKLLRPSRYEANVLTQNRFHWTMHLAGFGRKESGLEFMEYEIFRTQGQYLQAELVPYLNERHQEFLQTMNKNRLVGAGWVATMSNRDLTEDELMLIFKRLNAWGN